MPALTSSELENQGISTAFFDSGWKWWIQNTQGKSFAAFALMSFLGPILHIHKISIKTVQSKQQLMPIDLAHCWTVRRQFYKTLWWMVSSCKSVVELLCCTTYSWISLGVRLSAKESYNCTSHLCPFLDLSRTSFLSLALTFTEIKRHLNQIF